MCLSFNNNFLLMKHTNNINTYFNTYMIIAVVIAI